MPEIIGKKLSTRKESNYEVNGDNGITTEGGPIFDYGPIRVKFSLRLPSLGPRLLHRGFLPLILTKESKLYKR